MPMAMATNVTSSGGLPSMAGLTLSQPPDPGVVALDAAGSPVPMAPGVGAASSTTGAPGPVEALKELQRTDPEGREQWGAYCDERGGGVRDPSKHDPEFVRTFLAQYSSGQRLVIPQGPLAELMKHGQRKSVAWKQAWAGYCQVYGGGVNDPAKHDQKFLTGFMDFLGQSGVMALSGGLAAGMGGRRRGTGGMYGMYVDPKKDALVNRIKAFQRMGEEQKNAWGEYCDDALGGVRDPMRHDAGVLLSFCIKHGVP